MTIILLAKRISGVKMRSRLCLCFWTHRICWHVGKILALSLPVFTLYDVFLHMLVNSYCLFYAHKWQKYIIQVMQELGLIGLRIQRMPSEPNLEFGIPSQYSYMTVRFPSVYLGSICSLLQMHTYLGCIWQTKNGLEKLFSLMFNFVSYFFSGLCSVMSWLLHITCLVGRRWRKKKPFLPDCNW